MSESVKTISGQIIDLQDLRYWNDQIQNIIKIKTNQQKLVKSV